MHNCGDGIITKPKQSLLFKKNSMLSNKMLDDHEGGIGAVSENFDIEVGVRSLRQCMEEGALEDLNLYMAEATRSKTSLTLGLKSKETPLTLAVTAGHRIIAMALMKKGHARVDERNRYGQTGLHCSIKARRLDCVNCLLDFGADLNAIDCYGNQPLHYAAMQKDVSFIKILSDHTIRNMNKVLRGVHAYDDSNDGILCMTRITPLFHKVLQQHDSKHFCSDFVTEVVDRISNITEMRNDKGSYRLLKPTKEILDYILSQLFESELSGFWSAKGRDEDSFWIKTIPSPFLLSKILHAAFHYAAFNPSNKLKATPLHLACQANNTEAIAFMTRQLFCLFNVSKDLRGKTALDHVYSSNARFRETDLKILLEDFGESMTRYWKEKKVQDDALVQKPFAALLIWSIDEISNSENPKIVDSSFAEMYNEHHDELQCYLDQNSLSPFHANHQNMSAPEKMIAQAWILIKEMSVAQSTTSLRDGTEWVEYYHENSGEIFYHCANKKVYSLIVPRCEEDEFAKVSSHRKNTEQGNHRVLPKYEVCREPDPNPDSSRQQKSKENVSSVLSFKHPRQCTEYSFARFGMKYYPCQWGCGCDVNIVRHQSYHESNLCPRRIVQCSLGCSLKLPQYVWLKNSACEDSNIIQYHQKHDCPKRKIPCSYCGEFIPYETLVHHTSSLCPQRISSCKCRLGCGATFSRTTIDEMHEDRQNHELHFCIHRIISCEWKDCNAKLKESDMAEHVMSHIRRNGITKFDKVGMHEFIIPQNVSELLIRLWGAGGGGSMNERANGFGGGGGFVEAKLYVDKLGLLNTDLRRLTIHIGEGGLRGQFGKNNTAVTTEQAHHSDNRMGHSSGTKWAGGYGGQCTSVSCQHRASPSNEGRLSENRIDVPFLIAGGGGGGGRQNGHPGGVLRMTQPDLKTGNGEGGGIFSSPGISKGGIGGESYIEEGVIGNKFVCLSGDARCPGGTISTGDLYGIPALNSVDENGIYRKHGEGGHGSEGTCGCVEIGLPQYFEDTTGQ